MGMRRVGCSLKKVFGRPGYVLLGLVIALLFYLFNVVTLNWRTLGSLYGSLDFSVFLKTFWFMALGFKETITGISFISVIIISVLFGMLFSLITYKARYFSGSTSKKAGFFGALGIFFGALAPGCAACGIGLASTLGLSAGILGLLPYDGLEISILAIALLLGTMFYIADNLEVCSIKNSKKK